MKTPEVFQRSPSESSVGLSPPPSQKTRMKIVIPGGTGQVGGAIARHLAKDHDVVIIGRSAENKYGARGVKWDGKSLGDWVNEVDGADVLVNLAGRIINCRHTDDEIRAMYWSRVDTTNLLGQAIRQCKKPPSVWLNASTATIYRHYTSGPANDEFTGVMGGFEPGVPLYWKYSVDVAKAWEDAFFAQVTRDTRKVAMRMAFVVEPVKGGVLDTFYFTARLGFGGRMGSGEQWCSWIHEEDLVEAVKFVIDNKALEGPVNFAAPNPIQQAKFMEIFRGQMGIAYHVPVPYEWMVRMFSFFYRTESEIILKSRKVVPSKLLLTGFTFQYPDWETAAEDTVRKFKANGLKTSYFCTLMRVIGDVVHRWCGNTGSRPG